VPTALIALIGALFAAWGVAHVHGYTYPPSGSWIGPHGWSDYDEGVYLVSARLLNQQYALFSEIFSSQPPLFLVGLAFFLRLFNDAAGAGYLYSLTFGLLALGGVAWLCWETIGRWSAALSVLVLAISPGFVIAAHAVEAEAPMMGLTSLSVACAARYARTRARLWLTAASLLIAAGTLCKLLAVSAVVPLGVAIMLAALGTEHASIWRRLCRDAALAISCIAVPILAAFVLLSPPQQYDQVIRFHLQSEKVVGLADPSWTTFSTFLGWDIGLLGLAAAGVGAVAALRLRLTLIQFSWLLATVLSVARYYPLFIHHLTVLLPPLAAVAGGAFAALDHGRAPRVRRLSTRLLLVVGVLTYLLWLPFTVQHDADSFAPNDDPVKAAQVAWLQANSNLDDWVVTDNQVLAVAAHRLVPPALDDTSTVRARTGYLSNALLEQATDDPHVHAVLLTRTLKVLPQYQPYRAWLAQNFRQVPSVPQLQGALTYTR
jgi:4-amino-4-deoxy-L-arabinose transferase-like glycosyltransferase